MGVCNMLDCVWRSCHPHNTQRPSHDARLKKLDKNIMTPEDNLKTHILLDKPDSSSSVASLPLEAHLQKEIEQLQERLASLEAQLEHCRQAQSTTRLRAEPMVIEANTVEYSETHHAPFDSAPYHLPEERGNSKHVEKQLRLFQRAVEQSPASIIITDTDGNIEYVNPKFTQVTGYSFEEIKYQNPRILKSGETTDEDYAELWQNIKDGREWHGEFHNRKKNGELYWESASISPVMGENGTITHFLAVKEDITAYKNLQDLLQRTNVELTEAYRTLVDHSLQGLVILQAQRYVFANPMMSQITGYTVEELLAMSTADIINMFYPDDREMVVNYHQRRMQGLEAPTRYEHRIIRKDGEVRWLETHVTLTSYQGKPAAQAAYIDITERKQTEEALQRNEANLIAAQRIAHIGNWCWDIQTGGLHWADEIFRIFGLDPQECIITYPLFLHYIHPDDRAFVTESVRRAVQEQQPYNLHHRIVRPNGEERIVHEQGEIIYDQQGTPLRMIGTVQDVTERVQAEEEVRRLNADLEQRVIERTAELHQSQALLQGVLDHSPTGIFVTDTNHRYLLCNHYALSVFAFSQDNIIGKTAYDFMPTEIAARWEATSRRVQETQKPLETEDMVAYQGTLRTFLTLKFPIYDEQGTIFAIGGISTDITERKKIEERLQYAQQQAEAATRAKSEFLANMSHEIRTPMNAVIGMTNLLLDTPLNAEQYEYVETIRISGDALLTLINDILDFSKIEAGRMDIDHHPFNLRTCIEEALELLAPKAAEKGLEIAYQMDETLPEYLLGDITRVRQVIVNLISNAVKFTHHGEVVVVVTGSREKETESQLSPITYHLQVRDTGIGIAPEHMDRLFQSFSQVDTTTTREYGGTGLGLAISKKLVEMMGGTMWAESESGKGSTFHVKVTFEQADPTICQIPLPHAYPLKDKRILIVDDNATNRQIVDHYVRRWDMQARTVASGEEALELLRQGEHFDIAILDMHMPGMDGVQLATRIHSQELAGRTMAETVESSNTTPPPVPIVLYTSLMMRRNTESFNRANIAAVLVKPARPALLRETLINVMQGKTRPTAATSLYSTFDHHLGERHPLRILLAEDNIINQKVALRLLEKMGYRADVAANGQEVLNALRKSFYDVILMDVQMPEMDGVETTQRIREYWPHDQQPCIIALTAHAMQGDRQWLLTAGMDDYMGKPIRVEELTEKLQKVEGRAKGREVLNTQQSVTATFETSTRTTSNQQAEPLDMQAHALFQEIMGDMASQLITMFLEDVPEKMTLLQQASEAADADAIHRIAHTLKSSSAQLGAIHFSKICKELETKGRTKNLQGVQSLIHELDEEFIRLEQLLG
jgi:PAS domain S-box-containing protein